MTANRTKIPPVRAALIGGSLALVCALWCGPALAGVDRTKMRTGDWHLSRSEFAQARQCWNEAWAGQPETGDYALRMATSYALDGDYDRAAALLAAARARWPEDWRIHYHQGLVEVKRGDDAAAEKYLLELAAAAPWYPGPYLALGALYERKGDLSRAREMYVKELNVNCINGKAWQRVAAFARKEDDRAARRLAWLVGGGSLALGLGLLLVHHRVTARRAADFGCAGDG